MSHHNLEVIRRGIEIFNARDIDAFIELFDPQVELESAFAIAMSGAVYRGHEGLREWHRDLDEAWAEIRLDPERLFARGERVLAYYVLRGRGEHSGAEVAMPVAHVLEFRDGVIISLKTYADRERALLDFGGTEDAVEEPGS